MVKDLVDFFKMLGVGILSVIAMYCIGALGGYLLPNPYIVSNARLLCSLTPILVLACVLFAGIKVTLEKILEY